MVIVINTRMLSSVTGADIRGILCVNFTPDCNTCSLKKTGVHTFACAISL